MRACVSMKQFRRSVTRSDRVVVIGFFLTASGKGGMEGKGSRPLAGVSPKWRLREVFELVSAVEEELFGTLREATHSWGATSAWLGLAACSRSRGKLSRASYFAECFLVSRWVSEG